jgi:hypothetical protein
MAPPTTAPIRPSIYKDELYLYLKEPYITQESIMEYWRKRETKWPYLTKMAFDFLAISIISSKYKRVFLLAQSKQH